MMHLSCMAFGVTLAYPVFAVGQQVDGKQEETQAFAERKADYSK